MKIMNVEGVINIFHNDEIFQLSSKVHLDLLRDFVKNSVQLPVRVHQTLLPKPTEANLTRRRIEKYNEHRRILDDILKDTDQLRDAIAEYDASIRSTDGAKMQD